MIDGSLAGQWVLRGFYDSHLVSDTYFKDRLPSRVMLVSSAVSQAVSRIYFQSIIVRPVMVNYAFA